MPAIARDVACGLAHMHARGLIHRDMALRNILLNADGRAVIGDLGLCRFVDKDGWQNAAADAEREPLPRLLLNLAQKHEGRVRQSADVFMFGIAMAEAIAGRALHTPQAFAAWLNEFRAKHVTAEGLAVDESLAAVVLRCFEREDKRPSAAQLCQLLGVNVTASEDAKLKDAIISSLPSEGNAAIARICNVISGRSSLSLIDSLVRRSNTSCRNAWHTTK